MESCTRTTNCLPCACCCQSHGWHGCLQSDWS